MKTKIHSMLILLSALATANTFAQISNNGFENWTTVGNYMDPQGYLTPNAGSTGGFYPVTRDVSHYPTSLGNYSIRLENNTSLGASGVVLQNRSGNMANGPGPYFPISGHPTSLTGYYKYTPLNNDTMMIAVLLHYGGSNVAVAILTSTVTVSNWTSFSIPIPAYTTADSGSILLAAYHAGPKSYNIPYGNSVLNVDNLNFDNLITTGISEVSETNSFSVYPNPFTSATTLQTNQILKDATLTVYNLYGQTVNQIKNISGQTITFNRDNLASGLYFVRLTEENKAIAVDKLVITDK